MLSSTECVTFSLVWAFSEVTEGASVRVQMILWAESESFKAFYFGGLLFAFLKNRFFWFCFFSFVILSRASASLSSTSM